MKNAAQLRDMQCRHQDQALSEDAILAGLSALPAWQRQDGQLVREFSFRNYYETLAFVNALAFIVHAQDHHPELRVTWNRCAVRFHTHSVNNGQGGLSENDFICAAKIDALVQTSQ